MPSLARMSDEALMALRICDLQRRLKLGIDRSWLIRPVNELYVELEAAGLKLRPHVWLSQEWFSPAGISGIAIPFYLAHPRLRRLERQQMGSVEGGSHQSCMRILRHEAGHALQHAFSLHRRKQWRDLFGPSSKPYPDRYRPNPMSKRHVVHLDLWYAQSHPDEDFAETFAEWLRPGSRWRNRYAGWPAMRKLEYVEALMEDLRGRPALVRSKAKIEPLSELKMTLAEYYAERRARYTKPEPTDYDVDLLRLFALSGGPESAAQFMRKHHREVQTLVLRFAAEHAHALQIVWKEMSHRAAKLRLRRRRGARALVQELAVIVAMHTVAYVHEPRRVHPM
jgi:hypothetical protein